MDSLTLTKMELAELKGPFTTKLAFEAVRVGMAQAISDAGLTPQEFLDMMERAEPKLAADGVSTNSPLNWVKDYAGLVIGGGALLGAGSGMARYKIEQAFAGNSDPEMVALKKRIHAYHAMQNDLRTGMQAAA